MVVYLGSQRVGTSVVVSTGSTPIQEISLPVGQPLKTEEPFANETKGYVEQGNYVFSTEGDEVTEANVFQTGGTIGNDYVYTGAQGAYLTLPKPAPIQTADTWEFRTKYTFKAGQEISRILDTSADYENYSTPILAQWQNNNLYVWLSSRTGDPPDIVNAGNTGLSLVDNTTYYIKFGFTGTQYYVDYNTTGWDDTFTRQWTYTTTTKACCNDPMSLMGTPADSDVSSLGNMDLKETSITINNNLWWTGTRTVSSNYTYPDFVNTMKTYYANGTNVEIFGGVNGTQNGGTLTKNGVFTGAQGAYIDPSVDIAFQDADSWEFRTKYTHKSSGGGSVGQCLVGRKSNSNLYHWLIYIKSDKLKIYLSSTNSGWDIQDSDPSDVYQYECQDNVTYWLKVGFSGTEYYAYISTNGTDYTQILSVSSTSKVYNQGGMYLMKDNQESSSYAVGSMYLGETSVLINGVEYWRAANVINAKENANGLILYDLNDYTLSKYYGVDFTNNRVKLPTIDNMENIYYMVSPNYRNEAGGSPQPVPPTPPTPSQGLPLSIGQPVYLAGELNPEVEGYTKQGDYVFSTEGDEVTEANVIQTGGTMSNDSVFTGGSGAYLTLPEAAPIQTADTWEFRTKYTFKDRGSSLSVIMHTSSNQDNFSTPYLAVVPQSANNVHIWLSIAPYNLFVNSAKSDLILVDNTTYYIKFGFTGTQYYLSANTTGWDDSFTEYWTCTTTIKACCEVPMALMNAPWSLTTDYSEGDMDLKETSIIINGVLWWEGAKIYTSNYAYPDFVNTMKTLYTADNTSLAFYDLSGDEKINTLWGIDTTNNRIKTPIVNKDLNIYYCVGKNYSVSNDILYYTVKPYEQNPAMTDYTTDGFTASASNEYSGCQAYKGFNKDYTGENCWYSDDVSSEPWLALKFNQPYVIKSVQIDNENASPANFKDGYIQGRKLNSDTWVNLYTITNRPDTTAYSETYQINNSDKFIEFRLLITAAYSGYATSIQNINVNFE